MSDYLGKIKSGKAKAAGSGFTGKGLERLEKRRDDKDRAEKTTYGDTSEALSLSSREGAVIPYKPKGADTKPSEASLKGEADYTFTEIKVDIVHGPAPDKMPTGPSAPSYGRHAHLASLPAQTIAMFEKAKAEGRTVDAANLKKVVDKLTRSIELTKADKFGLASAPGEKKTKDPDATDWHAIFPINDYPQKARWKATNKEQMMILSEISGASITGKGESGCS
jgi:ATP-dependent RNA helicase DDX46/PRP5